ESISSNYHTYEKSSHSNDCLLKTDPSRAGHETHVVGIEIKQGTGHVNKRQSQKISQRQTSAITLPLSDKPGQSDPNCHPRQEKNEHVCPVMVIWNWST